MDGKESVRWKKNYEMYVAMFVPGIGRIEMIRDRYNLSFRRYSRQNVIKKMVKNLINF